MKYGALLCGLLMIVLASCSSERSADREGPTLRLGMSRDAALAIIKECGGQDVTRYQAIQGPHGESPPSGWFWDFEAYRSIVAIGSADDGKINQIEYWTHADFSVSKLHREESKKSLKAITFDQQSKTVKIVQ